MFAFLYVNESGVFGKNPRLLCFPYLPLIITVSPVYHLYAKLDIVPGLTWCT